MLNMDGNCLEKKTSARHGRLSSSAAVILAAVLAVSAAAVFFIAYFGRQGATDEERIGSATCEQAAEKYFDAFRESNAELYVSAMSEGKFNRQLLLFDGGDEIYDSYRSQFEDERDFFTAIYGADFKIKYEITQQTDADSGEIEGEEYISAKKLSVSVNINGSKANEDCEGTLTVIETEDGWYIYDSDFEKTFW
jgi:hypothetical protein